MLAASPSDPERSRRLAHAECAAGHGDSTTEGNPELDVVVSSR
jgi:hypothetical protein